jgi:hypothetical protein
MQNDNYRDGEDRQLSQGFRFKVIMLIITFLFMIFYISRLLRII